MKDQDIYTPLDTVCDGRCFECDGGCIEEDDSKAQNADQIKLDL